MFAALSLVALVLMAPALRRLWKRQLRSNTNRVLLALGLLLSGASCLEAGFGINNLLESYQRFEARRVDRLELIGESVREYAKEHSGRYPARFQDLIDEFTLLDVNLICPTWHERNATATYAYWGVGHRVSEQTPVVLVTEPLLEEFDGIHIFRSDGKTEFVPRKSAVQFLRELESGRNPPRTNR
jgi:hypothetical protein